MEKEAFNDRIKNWMNSKFNLLESIFAVTFLLAITLKSSGVHNMAIVILVAINFLTLLYIFNSSLMSRDENVNGTIIFINKIVFYGLAISLVGILFTLFGWPNADQFLLMGLISNGIFMIVVLFKMSNKSDFSMFNERYLIRMLLILSVVISLKFVPKSQLVKWKIIAKPQVTQMK
jgi:hypothetical protein